MSTFTAHNVRLDDGTQTGPSSSPSMETSEIFLSIKRFLNVIYGQRLSAVSIVDVGCLEGGYTTEFARMGMTATGIEVRENNFQNCMHIKARTDLPNLRFIKDDAYNILQHGPFDVAFVCGLLYHLDKPRQFLQDIAQITNKALIIDTHIAPVGNEAALGVYGLSRSEQNEGLSGRWFKEYDEDQRGNVESLKWAAFSNHRSFWIEKLQLLELLKSFGFDVILEHFDSAAHLTHEYTDGRRARTARVMISAVKSSA